MRVTDVQQWILNCTPFFEETVAFFRDVMGLEVLSGGRAQVDLQFERYVVFGMPNGAVLEIVEPGAEAIGRFQGPVVSIPVDDLMGACEELTAAGVEFVTGFIGTADGWAWRYFRGPDGNVYQVQGEVK